MQQIGGTPRPFLSKRHARWQAATLLLGLVAAYALIIQLAQPAAKASQATAASFAVFVDRGGTLGIADMPEQSFSPVVSTFGGRFTTAAYWLRITFDAADPPPMKLRFRPTTTDTIHLYTPRPDGQWHRSDTGEITPPTPDADGTFGWYSFAIDPTPGQPPFYARITTDSPGAISVSTVPQTQERQDDMRSAAWASIILAVQFLAMALVLKRLDPFHDLSHFAYLAMIGSFSVYISWFNGLATTAFPFLSLRQAEAIQEFFGAFTVMCLIAFHHLFLRDYDPPALLRRMSLALMVASAAAPLVRLAGYGQLSIKLAINCYGALVPLLLVSVLLLRRDAAIPRRQVQAVYAVYLLVLLANITLRIGLFDQSFLYRHSTDAITLVSSTMILALLWLQHRAALDKKLRRELELARLSTDLAVARNYSDRQRGLVRDIDAAAQQLFTATRDALTRGGFGIGSPTAERSVTALRDVIERCLLAQEAEQGHWVLRPEVFAPADLLRGLAAALAPPDRWHLDLDRAPLTTDRVLFELALRNVLSNALRYGSPTAPVSVTLRRLARHGAAGVQVTVRNASAVAVPFDPARVYDRFYRGPSAATQGGTGLGLFITREVMAALSGDITLNGPSGAGAPAVTAQLWVPDR